MERCKDCIWYKIDKWQDCSCPKMHYGYFYNEERKKFKDDEVEIEVDEGWGMNPGPMFGCVHWAKKE